MTIVAIVVVAVVVVAEVAVVVVAINVLIMISVIKVLGSLLAGFWFLLLLLNPAPSSGSTKLSLS